MTVLRAKTLALTAMALMLAAPHGHSQVFPLNLPSVDSKEDSDVKLPAFDVISVKPNKSSNGSMSVSYKQDGFTCMNVSLKVLISNAFGIRQELISGGPGWVDSSGFDVDAKVAGEDVATMKVLNRTQRRTMLQALLVERFHLKVHMETKTLPMYDLVVAKDGLKMKEAAAMDLAADTKDSEHAKSFFLMEAGPGTLKANAITPQEIANQLAYELEKTVADKTGLNGKYDINLQWRPEDSGSNSNDDSGVSIFTAVQEQLGLKLLPTKGPVETLVIDHAELPAKN